MAKGDGGPGGKGETLMSLLPDRVGVRQPLARPVHDRVRLVELAESAPQQQRAVARLFDQLQGTHQQRVGLPGTRRAAEEAFWPSTQHKGQLLRGWYVRTATIGPNGHRRA